MNSRREFLCAAAVSATALAAPSAGSRPTLGIVVSIRDGVSPDQALAKVQRLGLTQCQLMVGMTPVSAAPSIREAAAQHRIEITACMTLGEGRMLWNLREGPETIGIVPRATRAARIQALKQASDLAHACGVNAVHTHCGFIPENPNDELYAEAVAAIKDVGSYCRNNGQIFLCETGQETPITLLRALNDAALDNIAVNLDVANLILYGKGEPVGALDVLGSRVHGLHAKDGLYPTDPYGLGEEVAIGTGRVRFPEVIAKLHSLSYAGPITIEREIAGPKQEADLLNAKEYLENLITHAYGSA